MTLGKTTWLSHWWLGKEYIVESIIIWKRILNGINQEWLRIGRILVKSGITCGKNTQGIRHERPQAQTILEGLAKNDYESKEYSKYISQH